MKYRFIRRAGLRRLTARLPTAYCKSIELIVAASPYLIQALKLLQRRYRNQSVACRPESLKDAGDHEQPGDQLVQQPGTLSRHPTTPAADPPGDPARQALPDKQST